MYEVGGVLGMDFLPPSIPPFMCDEGTLKPSEQVDACDRCRFYTS